MSSPKENSGQNRWAQIELSRAIWFHGKLYQAFERCLFGGVGLMVVLMLLDSKGRFEVANNVISGSGWFLLGVGVFAVETYLAFSLLGLIPMARRQRLFWFIDAHPLRDWLALYLSFVFVWAILFGAVVVSQRFAFSDAIAAWAVFLNVANQIYVTLFLSVIIIGVAYLFAGLLPGGVRARLRRTFLVKINRHLPGLSVAAGVLAFYVALFVAVAL